MYKSFVQNKSNHVTIYKILFVDTECSSSAVSGSAPDGHQHEGRHDHQHQQREAHLTHAPQQQVHFLTLLTAVLSRYQGLMQKYSIRWLQIRKRSMVTWSGLPQHFHINTPRLLLVF